MKNIYVGNLPYSVRDDELRKTFEAYGTVKTAEVIIDRRRNRSRGYGFVVMPDDNEAQAAIELFEPVLGGGGLSYHQSAEYPLAGVAIVADRADYAF